MKFFRNPEVMKTLLLHGALSAVTSVAAFLWSGQFGVFTLVLCLMFVLVHIISTYRCYKKFT